MEMRNFIKIVISNRKAAPLIGAEKTEHFSKAGGKFSSDFFTALICSKNYSSNNKAFVHIVPPTQVGSEQKLQPATPSPHFTIDLHPGLNPGLCLWGYTFFHHPATNLLLMLLISV